MSQIQYSNICDALPVPVQCLTVSRVVCTWYFRARCIREETDFWGVSSFLVFIPLLLSF